MCWDIFNLSSFSPSPHNSWVTGEFRYISFWYLGCGKGGQLEFISFHKNGLKKKKLPFLIFSRMYFVSFLFLKSSCLMDRVRQKSLPCYLKCIKPGDKAWDVVSALLPRAWFWSECLSSWLLLCLSTTAICPVRSQRTARYSDWWPGFRAHIRGHRGHQFSRVGTVRKSPKDRCDEADASSSSSKWRWW